MVGSEAELVSTLRAATRDLRQGNVIPQGFFTRETCAGIEHLLWVILMDVLPVHESLDGVLMCFGRKAANLEAVVAGFAILISDQSAVPFYITVQYSDIADVVTRCECRFGWSENHRLLRPAYENASAKVPLLVLDEPDRFNWFLHRVFDSRV